MMVWKEDKQAYDQYCEIHAATIPLFFRREWLEAVVTAGQCLYLVAKEGDRVHAIYAGHYRRKYGLSAQLMPRLTPYLGLWAPGLDDEKKRLLATELLNHLPAVFYNSVCLHPDITDAMPWKWKGFHQQTRYTYILNAPDEWAYATGMSSKLGNHLKYAATRLSIDKTGDLKDLINLVEDSFGQQGMAVPYPAELLHRIAACGAACPKITIARSEDGSPQAALLTVEDAKTVYNLVSGRKSNAVRGAMALLLDNAIRSAIASQKTFDFEGSSIQSIATFFASFGGRLTSFHHVYRSSNRLTDALITIIGKYKSR